MRWNTQLFITKSKEKFGEKYDYSKTEYKNSKSSVIIICPIHGEFTIIPNSHLNSKTGCPKCSRSLPKKAIIKGIKRKEMREYNIWKGLKTRTTNPNTDDADRYINRGGVNCCKEWLNSFEQFYEDMGPCPKGYSIDRIDPNGNYCKENCRWASAITQSQNRGDFNKVFSYNGETHVLKEWCKIYNIKYETVITRINKHKWTLEEALLTPYGEKRNLRNSLN